MCTKKRVSVNKAAERFRSQEKEKNNDDLVKNDRQLNEIWRE